MAVDDVWLEKQSVARMRDVGIRFMSLAAIAAVSVACGAMGPTLLAREDAGGTGQAGCGPAEEPTLGKSFIRFADRLPTRPAALSSLEEISQDVVDRWGFAETTPALGEGFDSRFRVLDGAVLVTYIMKKPLGPTQTSADVLIDGAVRVMETVRTGLTMQAHLDTFTDDARERVEEVRIGPYEGIVSRGDEIAPDVRAWGVTWYEGDTRWKVSAVRNEGADVVDLARSMVCDPA